MIKKIALSLFVQCCLLLALMPGLSAQTIVIMVDNTCNPSLHVDNMSVPNGGVYNLTAEKVGDIQVYYANNAPAGSQVMITIKSASQNAAFEKSNVQQLFANTNAINIKELVKVPAGSPQLNLTQPFSIFVGCTKNEDAAYSCTLIPLPSGVIRPATGNAQGTGTPTNTNVTPAPQEKEYVPGSAVYDALKLADNANLSEKELQRIAQFYYPKQVITDVSMAKAALQQNPFLTSVVFKPSKSTIAASQSGGQLLSSLSLSSIGGLDVTNIVDGLAKFLVKRTKEELNTAFFEKFKATLDSFPDLQTLFPKTVNLLGSIGTEVYNYEKYIQNLREAFKDDISNLYQTLPGIIDNHPTFFARHHTLAASLRSGCYIVNALQQKVHPGDMLANYPINYLDKEDPSFKGAIQTLQLLSASMRDTTSANNTYWVNIKYLRQLVNNKNAFVIYLGLIHQMAINDYDSISFDGKSLVDILKNIAPTVAKANDIYNAYKTYILGFAEKTETLNSMIASYTKPANDSFAIELYKKYFDASQDLLEYAAQASDLPLADRSKFLSNLKNLLTPYFTITSLTTDLIVDINRKNYSAAINNAILIYDWVRNKPAQADARMAANASANSSGAPAASASVVASAAAPPANAAADANNATKVLRNLAKYGSFMSTIATAKTSDEVSAAIEAFALPAGSSRIKRQSDFNVALNAYVGPYVGAEYLPALKKNTTSFSAGLTAPVGIAFSWGKKRREETRHGKEVGYKSLSIFVPLIDIGTVAAFRFGNDSSSLTSTIQLKNIISPGLYLYYGLGKCPLSIGIGAQLGPQLRNISATNINVDKKSYIRFGVTIAVDLPLLNFYTKND